MDMTAPIYSDENKAREHLEKLLWPEGPFCPHCGNADPERIHKLAGKSTRPGVYKCRECEKPFSVTVNTVFEFVACAAEQMAIRGPQTQFRQKGHQRPSNPPRDRCQLQDGVVHVSSHSRGDDPDYANPYGRGRQNHRSGRNRDWRQSQKSPVRSSAEKSDCPITGRARRGRSFNSRRQRITKISPPRSRQNRIAKIAPND